MDYSRSIVILLMLMLIVVPKKLWEKKCDECEKGEERKSFLSLFVIALK